MTHEAFYKGIDQLGSDFASPQIQIFRWLHQHPELAYHEFKTSRYIHECLDELSGVEVHSPVAKTGIKAVLQGEKPGPTVAIRADIDALPVKEETGLEYASNVKTDYNGQETYVAHACGHDASTAAAIGTATILSKLRSELPGKVVFLFQPAEEGAPTGVSGGALRMVEEGALKDPEVQAIFGFHANSTCYPGQVMVREGPTHASQDSIFIRIWGEQAHGSQPWSGKDPIVAGASLINSLQTLISREVDLQKGAAVITVGYFWGGIKVNIIPEGAEMGLTVRSLDKGNREILITRIKELAEMKAEMHGCQAEVIFGQHYPMNINNLELYDAMLPTVERVAQAKNVLYYLSSTKSEDFSYFSREIPGLYMYYGAAPVDRPLSEIKPNHHPEFMVDEKALNFATRLECNLIYDCLTMLNKIF
ncbi:MAG: amidohydrolase [Methanobacterium sp. Maddingley MBC34]|nr:MAG: amidohydrolase [Methanobacterium sp. Maddingley MBC34]